MAAQIARAFPFRLRNRYISFLICKCGDVDSHFLAVSCCTTLNVCQININTAAAAAASTMTLESTLCSYFHRSHTFAKTAAHDCVCQYCCLVCCLASRSAVSSAALRIPAPKTGLPTSSPVTGSVPVGVLIIGMFCSPGRTGLARRRYRLHQAHNSATKACHCHQRIGSGCQVLFVIC